MGESYKVLLPARQLQTLRLAVLRQYRAHLQGVVAAANGLFTFSEYAGIPLVQPANSLELVAAGEDKAELGQSRDFYAEMLTARAGMRDLEAVLDVLVNDLVSGPDPRIVEVEECFWPTWAEVLNLGLEEASSAGIDPEDLANTAEDFRLLVDMRDTLVHLMASQEQVAERLNEQETR